MRLRIPGRARSAAPVLLCLGIVLATACGGEDVVYQESSEFDEFATQISGALGLGDVEQLVASSARVRVVCDERLVTEESACQGRPIGAEAEGFDVKFFGKEPTVLGGEQFRSLIDGMVANADFTAADDDFGDPGLRVYSTLYPDPVLWFESDDEESLPPRGDIAITYIGYSPSEDHEIKRRLWVAVAEQGLDGIWRIRLWLVGFFQSDHPAMNPSEENGFKRWTAP